MEKSANGLSTSPLSRKRRREESSRLDPAEHRALRALVGQAIWLGRMGVPELAFRASVLSGHLTEPLVEHLKEANSLVRLGKKLGKQKW